MTAPMLVEVPETVVQAEYRHRTKGHAANDYGAESWMKCRTPFCYRARHLLLGERYCPRGTGLLAADCTCPQCTKERPPNLPPNHVHEAAAFCIHCGSRLESEASR